MIPAALKRRLRPWRRRLRILLGRDLLIRPDHRCEREVHGAEGAAWCIHPGGLEPGSVVYSFGIGKDVSFDLALIERFGLRVHAFDPTPASLDWLRGEALPPGFVVHEYGLAARDGTATFYPPERADHVSHTLLAGTYTAGERDAVAVPVRRLAGIMAELGHARVDLLKMDIEGAEYAVLEDILAAELPIGQLLVEYHHRFPGVGLDATRESVALLRRHGYRLFHVSPSGEEYSFLRAAG